MSELKLKQCRLDGRYDILECLGRGSYAEIYVAHDLAARDEASAKVVIKALNLFLQGAPEADLERTLVENFENEAIALDRVRHPHIISRLGHGTALDLAGRIFHYLVLEYMPGGDLAARCRLQPLSLERTLSYLEQVCAGLAHAHAARVIHRDIKPQNLLLSADLQIIKIADFGVAKLGPTEEVITRVGTDVYSPPEHNPHMRTGPLETGSLAGPRYQLTPAADVYALAKTVYMMLAGESPRRFAQKQITSLPPGVADHFWSESVLKILRTATEPRVEARYQSVGEFLEEMQEASLAPTVWLGDRTKTAAPVRATASLPALVAPPAPDFPQTDELNEPRGGLATRPRIVVPLQAPPGESAVAQQNGGRPAAATVERPAALPPVQASPFARRSWSRRLLPPLLLLLALSGMLLATHAYFRRSPGGGMQARPAAGGRAVEYSSVGREAVTITTVNLRPDPGTNNRPLGVVENGSKVRVLDVRENWAEVEILQPVRTRDGAPATNRGWINRRFLTPA